MPSITGSSWVLPTITAYSNINSNSISSPGCNRTFAAQAKVVGSSHAAAGPNKKEHAKNKNKAATAAPSTTTTEEPKSKRQQFRETPVPPSIQHYLEMIGVGIPSRRKGSKRSRSALFQNLESGRRSDRTGSYTKPPPPFSTGGDSNRDAANGGSSSTTEEQQDRKVVVIGSVASINDSFPTNKELIPEVVRFGFDYCVLVAVCESV